MAEKVGLFRLAVTMAFASVLFLANPASAAAHFAAVLERISPRQNSDFSIDPVVTAHQAELINKSTERAAKRLLFASTSDISWTPTVTGAEIPPHGKDIDREASEVLAWYRKFAEQGYAGAQHNLALMHHFGQGVPRNYADAVKWYRKAAAQGYAGSQHTLGVLYESGEGVTQDFAEAARWYRKAAEQGYAGAQNNLGLLYESGQGVQQDFAKAVNWYRKASEQGVTQAQFNLGVAYAKGRGVAHDLIQAHLWFNLAARQGLTNAIVLRELIADGMTPDQIAEAELRADGWLHTRRKSPEKADHSPRAGQC